MRKTSPVGVGTLFTIGSLAAWNNPVLAETTPSITITSPTNGSTVTSTHIPVTVSVKDFNLEMQFSGMPPKVGQGHIHVMLDGMDMEHLTNMTASKNITVLGDGVSPGEHTLYAELASDDHAAVGEPATLKFNYRPRVARPLPQPSGIQPNATPQVTIISPKSGETLPRKFTLKVDLKNFDLSCAEGKQNAPGTGHLHVFVSQPGVAQPSPMPAMLGMSGMAMPGMVDMPCTAEVPMDLSAWKTGVATLTVTLANNDHTSVSAPAASVTMNLK